MVERRGEAGGGGAGVAGVVARGRGGEVREGVTEPIELGLDVVEGNVGGVRGGGGGR